MNILLVNHYAGSPEMGMEFRPYYMAKEWVKMGHVVTIIAGDYSHLRKTNPSVENDFQEEEIDEIKYVWIKTGEYEGNGLKRAQTMFRFIRKLKKNVNRLVDQYHPDVVIASSTYPLDTYPVQEIAKRANAKYIHEVHDMWPATLYEVGGMSRNNPFVKILQKAEDSAYKHCDACVSLLPYAKEYMVEHGLKEEKFYWIPNGVVVEEWETPRPLPEEHRSVFAELRKKGKFIVGYFGGHALSNCLLPFIKAAELSSDETVHFVLVGDGAEKKELVHYAQEHGLEKVTFLPPVGKKAVPTLVENFDCIYIGAKDSPLYRFGVCMNKMFDSMMAGKAIIFAINAPATPVTDNECGIVIKPEKPEEIIQGISEIKAMESSDINLMGSKGQHAIYTNFIYSKLAEDFIDVISN